MPCVVRMDWDLSSMSVFIVGKTHSALVVKLCNQVCVAPLIGVIAVYSRGKARPPSAPSLEGVLGARGGRGNVVPLESSWSQWQSSSGSSWWHPEPSWKHQHLPLARGLRPFCVYWRQQVRLAAGGSGSEGEERAPQLLRLCHQEGP